MAPAAIRSSWPASVTARRYSGVPKPSFFLRHGFHPVGVDWIIDDSGVARMTLYRHFAGNDDLVRERYAHIVESIEQRLSGLDDPVSRVKGIFDWYGAWFCTPQFAGCLFERALAEFGTTCPKVSEVAIRYREKMVNWIETLHADVVSAYAAHPLASVYNMMLLDGATIDARAFHDPPAATRAWSAAHLLLPQAISTSSAQIAEARSAG